jgi:hypothetical protein
MKFQKLQLMMIALSPVPLKEHDQVNFSCDSFFASVEIGQLFVETYEEILLFPKLNFFN